MNQSVSRVWASRQSRLPAVHRSPAFRLRALLDLIVLVVAWPAVPLLTIPFLAGPSWSQSELSFNDVGKQGFVFIEGKFIAPPYRILWDDESLKINEYEFTALSFDLSGYGEADLWESGGRRGGRRGRTSGRDGTGSSHEDRFDRERSTTEEPRPTEPARLLRTFAEQLRGLDSGLVAVLYTNEPPLLLLPADGAYDLLRAISSDGSGEPAIPNWVARERDQAVWAKLISDFQPSDDFQKRVRLAIERSSAAEVEGERVTEATLWIQKMSYPLTVFAMIVVVLGFGHLLSNRPKIETTGEVAEGDWSKHRSVVGQSLLIVAMLSAVDLIWTIGTADSGVMRELNPLGSRLITEPLRLFLFKFAVTLTSITILYGLHRRPVAQIASWWCCLLLTLLTARWLVFQSLFL